MNIKIDISSLLEEKIKNEFANYNEIWNPFPENKCLQDLFEEQVDRTPEGIALRFNNQEFTYTQLNQKANRLAHYLISKGVKPETSIAIGFERSFEMIISVIAVLKAGCAYVPLDPSLPVNRLSFMLEDTRAPYILAPKESLFTENYNLKSIDPLPIVNNEDLSNENPGVLCKSNNLAYIIYTSGSTGKPKGVMIEHQGVVCLMYSLQERYSLELQETFLLQSPFHFDASVEEIFWPLLFGGTTVIAPPKIHQDLNQLVTLIQNQNIQNLQFVPSLLDAFSQISKIENCSSLKRIFSGGETLSSQTRDRIINTLPETILFNDYGPTEATVSSITHQCTEIYFTSVPIGYPITNKTVYIIDEEGNHIQAPGIPGELYIGGYGIARGYLNLPDQTRMCFVTNPYASQEDLILGRNLKLYKTGDRVQFLVDGNIEFLGRLDEQVKIRGHRIELGEIKNNLLQHPQLNSAFVQVYEEQDIKKIVAYIVPVETINQESLIHNLKNHLTKLLPNYMIPNEFVVLQHLPLTPTGKIDRDALPKPNREYLKEDNFTSPLNETEHLLSEIWKSILKLNHVSKFDNFFQIGGHSLLTIKLSKEIQKVLGCNVSLAALFEMPTLSQLAAYIEQENKKPLLEKTDKISQPTSDLIPDIQNLQKSFPLTTVQQAYWIGRKNVYELGNVSSHGYSEYECENLDIIRLEKAGIKSSDTSMRLGQFLTLRAHNKFCLQSQSINLFRKIYLYSRKTRLNKNF